MIAVFAVSGAIATSCRSARQADVDYLARFVPAEMARHLVLDDDRDFRKYAAAMGLDAVSLSYHTLFLAPHDSSVAAFTRAESTLAPACVRLANALADEYRLEVIRRRYAAYIRHPVHERMRLVALTVTMGSFRADTTLSLEQKAQWCLDAIDQNKHLDVEVDIGQFYADYCELLPRIRGDVDVRDLLRTGMRETERTGDYTTACQMLGQLGYIHAQAGDIDSMRACWDRALAYARRVKSWQEARILSFYANHYGFNGRLALAREYFLQAQARCRELQDDRHEIIFLVKSLYFFADLGCWELVDGELPNADTILRRLSVWEPQGVSAWTARIELLRAERGASGGDCTEHEHRIRTALPELSAFSPVARQDLQLASARTLARCGRYEEAQNLLAAGRKECEAFHIPGYLPNYDLEIAATNLALGDMIGTESSLRSFREAVVDTAFDKTFDQLRLWSRHDVSWVKVALLARDRGVALGRFSLALARAAARQHYYDSSPEAYLVWAEAEPLRDLGHEVLFDPRIGYAFEMGWRRMRASGSRAWLPEATDGESLLSQLLDDSKRLETAVAKAKAIHCVYRMGEDVVVRWTAAAGRIERDTLDATSTEIASLVADMRRGLWASSKVDRAFVRASARLGQLLLPRSLFENSAAHRLLISADGALAELPFAALSLSSTQFEPLIARYDVASLRFDAGPGSDPTGPPVVVYDPDIAPSLRRRFSVLEEALPRAAVEAARVRAAMPEATVLSGSSATKEAFLENATQAPMLYVASHVIQDPEIPYIAFIPLAATESQRAEDSYLELSDIRGADLSRCRLAVLSGCGTGRSYVSTTGNCPSLGEVLVDAGVRAVVQTYVEVRDGDAEMLMADFLDALQRGGSTVQALAEAQRRAHRAGRDPANWAAYSLTLGAVGDDEDGTFTILSGNSSPISEAQTQP